MRAPLRLLAVCIPLLCAAPQAVTHAQGQPTLDIYYLDVEGGGGTLIVSPSGAALLIDAGWPGPRDAERILAAARQADLGKTVGDDFAEGKVTLPVILAFDRGNEEERAFWSRVLCEGGRRAEDFHRAVALLTRHDALGETLEWARSRAEDAKRELRAFPDGPARTVLADIADFCVDRVY